MSVLIKLAVLAGVILALARFLPGVRIQRPSVAVVAAVIFSLLNFLLGWLIAAGLVLISPLTLFLLLLVLPFALNTVLLWLTDKLMHTLEFRDLPSLLLSSGAITLANWLLRKMV